MVADGAWRGQTRSVVVVAGGAWRGQTRSWGSHSTGVLGRCGSCTSTTGLCPHSLPHPPAPTLCPTLREVYRFLAWSLGRGLCIDSDTGRKPIG